MYGVLNINVQTTCHPAFWHKLPTFRAVKTNLQVSEELTTSRGPGTCFQFSVSLVEQLFGESASMEMGKYLVRLNYPLTIRLLNVSLQIELSFHNSRDSFLWSKFISLSF